MTLSLTDLGSVGIMKVLECVTKQGTINISHLSRKTGLNHTSVDSHVRKLVALGLVEEKRYGALRMIKPAFDSLTARAHPSRPHWLSYTYSNPIPSI